MKSSEKPCKSEKIFTEEKTSIHSMLEEEPSELEMLIPSLIPKTSIVIISAPGGSSKSFMALQLGFSLAAKKKFLGKFEPVKRRRVLYISGEDDKDEVHRRLKSIVDHQLDSGDPAKKAKCLEKVKDRLRIAFTHEEPNFLLYSNRTPLDNADRIIKFCVDALERPPDLIILDNLTVFHDADHNSADQASGMMRQLRKIHNKTLATVLLIAHTNKSSQEGNINSRLASASVLGSTAFSNNSRLVISMTQVNEGDKLTFPPDVKVKDVVAMKISKANSGILIKDILFLKRNHNGVVEYIEPITADPRIEVCKVLEAIGDNPEISKTELVGYLRTDCGMSKNAATNLIERVLADKLILQEETGTNNRKIFKITQKGEQFHHDFLEDFEQPEEDDLDNAA